jgi:uroporphyrin-III C-methyltransferase
VITASEQNKRKRRLEVQPGKWQVPGLTCHAALGQLIPIAISESIRMKVTKRRMAAFRINPTGGLVALHGGAGDGLFHARDGKVWLIGAGPGDPELLTRKAERILGVADVVVHDRLVGTGVLRLAAPTARRLYVGKRKSSHSVPQDELNGLLIALAREGLQVVRLKGGDPFVFGRGGEELLACRAAGVACEVVPGISAALAAAASTGVPLTHRGAAQAVTFVTGHAAAGEAGDPAEPDLDWTSLARPNQTVAVYMGLSTAEIISNRLIAAGRSPSTPVVMVERASHPDERHILGTLATLPQLARPLVGPAILLIGEVAALADAGSPSCLPNHNDMLPLRSCL